MSVQRVWTEEQKSELLRAYKRGGLALAHSLYPEMTRKAVSTFVGRLRSTRGDRSQLMVRPCGIPVDVRRKTVAVQALGSADKDYVRKRIDFTILQLSSEIGARADSVKAAILDWASREMLQKPLEIETETNAVDCAYGDAAKTVSFKFGTRG